MIPLGLEPRALPINRDAQPFAIKKLIQIKSLSIKREAFVIPLGLEPRALPINRDAQPFAINASIYFLDFIFLICSSLCFASFNVSKNSLYTNFHGKPKDVNLEWPIECSCNLLSTSMQAPIHSTCLVSPKIKCINGA